MIKTRKLSDNSAQLFIVAGVIITIMIVVSSIATLNSSSVTKPIDKSDFIRSNFENVKADFGFYLNDILTHELLEDRIELDKIFDDSVRLFKFAQARHNYYFDAEIISVMSYSNSVDTIKVNLTLSDLDDSMTEIVYYYIT